MLKTFRTTVATTAVVFLVLGCAGGDDAPAEPATDQETAEDETADADDEGDDPEPADDPASGSDDPADEVDAEGHEDDAEAGGGNDEGDRDSTSAAGPDGNEEFGNVTLALEPVLELAWDDVDDAFSYTISVDGVEYGRTFSPAYLLLDESGEITVTARNIEDDTSVPVVADVTESTRFVVRWDEQAVPNGFVGLTAPSFGAGWGSAGSPHIIRHPPDDIEVVLFGEPTEVERQEADGTTTVSTSAPFDFEFGEIIEHGPYIELPLPDVP